MRSVTIRRLVNAPVSAVWAVLADYPNISDWNDGVKQSCALGDSTEGVGAQRRCELEPKGTMRMRETVTEWVPEQRMVVEIDDIEKMPVRGATMTFMLAPSGDRQATDFTMHYQYDPKGGPAARLFGPMLDRQMGKGFNGFVDNLERAATTSR